MDVHVLRVPGRDARRLERGRGGVEAGVQDGRIGLGRAVEEVVRAFQHHDPRPRHGKCPRDRAADHARTDDGDVVQAVGEGIGDHGNLSDMTERAPRIVGSAHAEPPE